MWLTLLLLAQAQPHIDVEPGHERNPIYTEALRSGWSQAGVAVAFPGPILGDDFDPAAERAALLKLAGSEDMRSDLLRDSVTAPFILKVHDQKGPDATIRIVDLWFAVRANLDELDPLEIARKTSGKAAEGGNMRFETRLLTDPELKTHGRTSQRERDFSRWFVQLKGQLLDRIALQATDETVATRTGKSLVIAGRTDPGFDSGSALANRWWTLESDGRTGPEHRYRGGMSYAKISHLRKPEGTLLVEFHGAFCEPHPWFGGAPILRSKFAPIAQDQIRKLRRELLKARRRSVEPTPNSP